MKIAIYHNLEPGGALNYLIETTKYLHKKNNVDVFSFKDNIPKNIYNNLFLFDLSKTNNLFTHIYQVLFELRNKNRLIAQLMNHKNYDLVIVHPCILTQAPYILRYLKNQTVFYIFHEPKREFYEPTSYFYFQLKPTITRLLRYFIKFIDKNNCKCSKINISNSYYSSYIFENIYHKKSFVIHLGMEPIKPNKILFKNNNKLISTALLSKIKGHEFSIRQIASIKHNLTIIGKNTSESYYLHELANKKKVKINLINSNNYIKTSSILKKFSVYLANPTKEPFGIATLEASENNCYILGKNEGGTPEIVRNGLNGTLYPNDLLIAKNVLKSTLDKQYINLYKTSKINWKYPSNRIIEIYHHLTHTPNE